jgi:hypothetical protein
LRTESTKHSINVTGISHVVNTDTRVNVKKRRENILHRTLTNISKANLNYARSAEVTPAANLAINDRSNLLKENSSEVTTDYTEISGVSFLSDTQDPLVTGKYTVATTTQDATPLFHSHLFVNFNPDNSDWTGKTLISWSFLDSSFDKVDENEYLLDTALGKVFNNLENDTDSIDPEIYYVRYTVRPTGGTAKTYSELLNNVPAYHPASFGDLDAFGNLDVAALAYLSANDPSGKYLITMPTTSTYSYKHRSTTRIRILEPSAQETESPWHVRISKGDFASSINTGLASTTFKYRIAEFNNQSFTPYAPYKFYHDEKASIVTKRVIQVGRNVVTDADFSPTTDIIVKSATGTVLYAYTTDEAKVGEEYGSSEVNYSAGIASVDNAGGLIEVEDVMDVDHIIYVSYYSTEAEYEFVDYSFNPVSNRDALQTRVVVYINPESVKTGTLSQTVHYLEVDNLGRVTHCSQAVDGSIDAGTVKLLGEDFYSDGRPQHTIYYDKTSTASGLYWSTSLPGSQYRDEFSFKDKYTVDTALDYAMPSGQILTNRQTNPRFFPLAEIRAVEASSVDTIEEVDIRTRGGGIREDKEIEAIEANEQVLWHWDLASQMSYAGAGALFIKFPQDILSDNGGDFTKDQIRDIVQRHMTGGGYPVMRSYGPVEPAITDMVVGSGSLTASWPSYGPAATYDLYYSSNVDNGYVVGAASIPDNTDGNSATVTGLNTNASYYVYIQGTKHGESANGPPSLALTIT